jgi:hypothetical protein
MNVVVRIRDLLRLGPCVLCWIDDVLCSVSIFEPPDILNETFVDCTRLLAGREG